MEAWNFYKKGVASINGQFNTQRDAVTKRLNGLGYGPSDEKWISDMVQLESFRDTELAIFDKSDIVRNLKRISSQLQTEATLDLQAGLTKQLGRPAANWEVKLEGVQRYTP